MKLAVCAAGVLAFIAVMFWPSAFIGGGATAGPVAGLAPSSPRLAATVFLTSLRSESVPAPAAPAGAGAATAPNAAGVCWCAAHDAKSCGVTVNTLKRMFACDDPQYSA